MIVLSILGLKVEGCCDVRFKNRLIHVPLVCFPIARTASSAGDPSLPDTS